VFECTGDSLGKKGFRSWKILFKKKKSREAGGNIHDISLFPSPLID
jgi:hypothetical protein